MTRLRPSLTKVKAGQRRTDFETLTELDQGIEKGGETTATLTEKG